MLQAIKNKTGNVTKTHASLAALVAILLGGAIWAVNVDQQGTLTRLTEASCAYDITDSGEDLVPSIDGKRIGTFERYGDGDVQLTLGNGFSPKANICIEKAGFGDRISSIRKYR